MAMTTITIPKGRNMDAKDSFSSRSSLPLLLDEYDENDEIVIFEEEVDAPDDPSSYDEYYLGGEDDYDDDGGDEWAGYTSRELAQQVEFVHSSKDPQTGNFVRELKCLRWCVENEYEEVEPGVWSGSWYFTYLLGEKEGKRAWVEAMNKRLVKECGGKAMKVDHVKFCKMLREKEKGNRSFSRGQYKSALDNYLSAEKLLGGAVSGMFLVPHQRAELVKVLSNQAECYLRMKKFDDTIIVATAALQLDKRHQKSLMRRAKALYEGSGRLKTYNSGVAASVAEDLQTIIDIGGDGSAEARELLDQIEMKKIEK